MQRQLRTLAGAGFVFAAGFAAAHLAPPAAAAAPPLTPQLIDLTTIGPDDLPPPPRPGSARTRIVAVADGATVQVQMGPVQKHYHADANEVQYVVDGTGTEWLDAKQVALKPGTMLIIPKGTAHGGTTDPTGRLKLIAIKTPPQASDDVHPLP